MKVSIVIPVFNEEATVRQIVNCVKNAELPLGFSKEMIVVNDASNDKTLSILQSLKVKIISHKHNLGKGAAVMTAVKEVKGDLILIQDADLEYDPQDYVKLLTPFKNNDCLVVYGSRLINYPLMLWGKNKTPLPFHWMANKFLTFLTNIIYGNSVTDMETGYKVIQASLLKSLNIQAGRFDFEPEITAKILKKNIKIIEVPITVKPRSYREGKKIGWRDGVMAVWTIIKFRFTD